MSLRAASLLFGLFLLASIAPLSAQLGVPVVLYQEEGGFVSPPPLLVLTVYSSGDAVLIKRDGLDPNGTFCHAQATAAEIQQLVQDLDTAGAFFLTDNLRSVIQDVPRSTVTVFTPASASGTRARSNTFSFGAKAHGRYIQAYLAVKGFRDSVFPRCSGDDPLPTGSYQPVGP